MKPKPFRYLMTCACGDQWGGGPLPRKYRTREFFEFMLAWFTREHIDKGHLYRVEGPEL